MQGSLFGSSLQMAEAEAPSSGNVIETLLSKEFDPRSLDGVPKDRRVKYDFEMKSRDQHL